MTLSHTQVLLCSPATPLISPRLFILSILVHLPSVTVPVRSLSDWLGRHVHPLQRPKQHRSSAGAWQTVGSSDEERDWVARWRGEKVRCKEDAGRTVMEKRMRESGKCAFAVFWKIMSLSRSNSTTNHRKINGGMQLKIWLDRIQPTFSTVERNRNTNKKEFLTLFSNVFPHLVTTESACNVIFNINAPDSTTPTITDTHNTPKQPEEIFIA